MNDGDDADVGASTAVLLINELAVSARAPAAMLPALARVLAVDPHSVSQLEECHGTPFTTLARRLHRVVVHLHDHDVDAAARLVNEMLAEHSAHPHLAKEHGRWCLHHHPANAELVAMWSAIFADALARLIGNDQCHRIGVCSARDCHRSFFDQSKNASRRFCSTTCQNRVKAAAFRERHRPA